MTTKPIYIYLRVSTAEQDVNRAENTLREFARKKGAQVVHGVYREEKSGTTLNRPVLQQMLADIPDGSIVIVESVDRISRLRPDDWGKLKLALNQKSISLVCYDLPTSHLAFEKRHSDEITASIVSYINDMLIDVLSTVAYKDWQQRKERAAMGIEKAKREGKYKGRQADEALHKKIVEVRTVLGKTIRETARYCDVSVSTVTRVMRAHSKQQEDVDCGS